MLDKIYDSYQTMPIGDHQIFNSLITDFELKEDMQIVFKDNKAWIFDYHNSLLYNLNQIAALLVFMKQKGHTYKEIVTFISSYYEIPIHRVDSDIQSLLNDMFKNHLLNIG